MTVMEDAALIGRRVKERREARRWDQSELSRRSGVSGSYISRLEAGVYKRPSADRLAALALALGCRVTDLTDPAAPDDAGALTADLYALGFRPDEAPLVEKLVEDLSARPPKQRRQILDLIGGMLALGDDAGTPA